MLRYLEITVSSSLGGFEEVCIVQVLFSFRCFFFQNVIGDTSYLVAFALYVFVFEVVVFSCFLVHNCFIGMLYPFGCFVRMGLTCSCRLHCFHYNLIVCHLFAVVRSRNYIAEQKALSNKVS